MSDWPLPIGVEEVVAVDSEVGVVLGQLSGQGCEVGDIMVGRYVFGSDGGVVARSSPVLTPSDLEFAALIGLEDGEGGLNPDFTGRGVHQVVESGLKW